MINLLLRTFSCILSLPRLHDRCRKKRDDGALNCNESAGKQYEEERCDTELQTVTKVLLQDSAVYILIWNEQQITAQTLLIHFFWRQWKTMAGLPGSGAMKALKMSLLLRPCSLLKALEEGASYLDGVYIIREALHTFTEGWDNHPLRSEGGLSPNQLWVLGHMKNPCDSNEDLQNTELFETDWEMFGAVHEEPYGVQVQEIECPLTPYIMETAQSMINPLASSESFGRYIYITMVQCIESLRPTQEIPEM